MRRLLKYNWRYLGLTVLIFAIEIAIAKYAHDRFIRPYVGDFLVVILIYCFIKSFLNAPVFITALSVLIFSYIIEALQYFHIVTRLGLQRSKIARTIIGTSFEWSDLVAYTIGAVAIIYLEKTFANGISKKNYKTV